MEKLSLSKEYKQFLTAVKEKVYQSQYQAMKQVNKALISLYWDIGKDIVEKQQKHKWGKSVVEKLAEDLQNEFPGLQGWSSHNLWRMRKFYLMYNDDEKLAPLVQEIGWSHNIILMEKCKDWLEREFYIKMTIKYGWTKDVLIHQVVYQQHGEVCPPGDGEPDRATGGDDKLLKLMYVVAKEYNDDDDFEYQFSEEDIKIFEERTAKRLSGESKTHSWEDAKAIITGQKKME